MKRFQPRERGAALLMAMMIVALVATLASAMVWQQWRAVQVESAERARTQSSWILNAGVDWGRLILREDARTANGSGSDDLGEPWAVPLAESRLSAFLAADKDHTDDALDAFFSGSITDAQGKYNLRNVLNGDNKIDPDQLKILSSLCNDAGLALKMAKVFEIARSVGAGDGVFLEPHSLSQLSWFGLSADVLSRLEPFLVVLPGNGIKVNVNTAPAEVIAAVSGYDLSVATRLVAARQSKPFKALPDAQKVMAGNETLLPGLFDTKSSYFELRGRLRLERRVLEEVSLVKRDGMVVTPIWRERQSLKELPE